MSAAQHVAEQTSTLRGEVQRLAKLLANLKKEHEKMQQVRGQGNVLPWYYVLQLPVSAVAFIACGGAICMQPTQVQPPFHLLLLAALCGGCVLVRASTPTLTPAMRCLDAMLRRP